MRFIIILDFFSETVNVGNHIARNPTVSKNTQERIREAWTWTKMDTFWIHCNRCNMLLSDATERNVKFYVANCTHIFCQECMTAVSQTRKCNCCPNKSLRSIGALDPTLRPEIKPFFSNVLMNTKSVHQALEYQTNQIKHMVGMYRKHIGTLGNQLR